MQLITDSQISRILENREITRARLAASRSAHSPNTDSSCNDHSAISSQLFSNVFSKMLPPQWMFCQMYALVPRMAIPVQIAS